MEFLNGFTNGIGKDNDSKSLIILVLIAVAVFGFGRSGGLNFIGGTEVEHGHHKRHRRHHRKTCDCPGGVC